MGYKCFKVWGAHYVTIRVTEWHYVCIPDAISLPEPVRTPPSLLLTKRNAVSGTEIGPDIILSFCSGNVVPNVEQRFLSFLG